MAAAQRVRGAVLILVLWFLAAAAVFAAVMASESRLTAKAVFHGRQAMLQWAATMDAVHRGEMELMLARMPEPVKDQGPLSERRNPRFRFNGAPLEPAYGLPEGVELRIWDHAGKINIGNISRTRMEELLSARVADEDQRAALLDAWQDWIDNDDLKRVNGAEEEYYSTLDPPYKPRNAPLESVEELRLIKGFAELLEGVDLHAVFTIYGGNTGVNPNLASPEVLALLPGMSEETVARLLAAREEKDLTSRVDITDLLEVPQARQVMPWFQFTVGNFYTIAVRQVVEGEGSATPYGYQRVVQARGYQQPPLVLWVRPFAPLPASVNRKPGAAEAEERTGG